MINKRALAVALAITFAVAASAYAAFKPNMNAEEVAQEVKDQKAAGRLPNDIAKDAIANGFTGEAAAAVLTTQLITQGFSAEAAVQAAIFNFGIATAQAVIDAAIAIAPGQATGIQAGATAAGVTNAATLVAQAQGTASGTRQAATGSTSSAGASGGGSASPA